MQLHDVIPFWPDKTTYYVPWVKFKTDDGSKAEGPMMRKGVGRQEILAWVDRPGAEAAAREIVDQTGGSFEVKTMDRKALWAQCRQYASWGSRVVAVIMK